VVVREVVTRVLLPQYQKLRFVVVCEVIAGQYFRVA